MYLLLACVRVQHCNFSTECELVVYIRSRSLQLVIKCRLLGTRGLLSVLESLTAIMLVPNS